MNAPGRRATNARTVESGPAGTRSIVRTCEILRLLGSTGAGLTVTEVADALGLPKSSAHRYLAVLEAQRFVERHHQGHYALGLSVLTLQSQQTELLVQRAQPLMESLRDRFDETVNLGILVRHCVTYLHILESTKGVRHAVRKGEEDYVHSTALGKAIAATLSEREVLELLAKSGMPRCTPKTIVDPGIFLRELESVRNQGYGVDDRENEEAARCVAVAIPDLNLSAAISVSGVAARFPMSLIPAVAEALQKAAAQVAAPPERDGGGPNIVEREKRGNVSRRR